MISGLIIALFLFFMLAGVPVCIALGLSTVISMLVGGYDLIVLPQRMAASIQSIELMAIPFFVLVLQSYQIRKPACGLSFSSVNPSTR